MQVKTPTRTQALQWLAEMGARNPQALKQTLTQLQEKRQTEATATTTTATPSVSPRQTPTLESWIDNEVTIIDTQSDNDDEASGSVISFKLWPYQRAALHALQTVMRLLVLKSRQVGFTWLVIAYCVWVCIHYDNREVLFLSKDLGAAKKMLARARGIFVRLLIKPVSMTEDAKQHLVWSNGSAIHSLAATEDAGSSYTASIVVLDEFAKMRTAVETYNAIKPTVSDGRAQLIGLSSAKGRDNLFAKLWKEATAKLNNFTTIFVAWFERPGRDQAWYNLTAADAPSMAHHTQEYPATPDEAFQDLIDDPFIDDMAWWDSCFDPEMPVVDKNTELVVALDAGADDDSFGMAAVSPHPTIEDHFCIHFAQEWVPPEGGQVQFREPFAVVDKIIEDFDVLQVACDPSQLVDYMQRLRDSGDVSVYKFVQLTERNQSDRYLRELVQQRRLHHNGNATAREHIRNANRRIDEQKRLRIVKRAKSLKIDVAVAISMAVWRCHKLSA